MRTPESRTLFELLSEQAKKFGDRPAVVCGGLTTTYRELADRAARFAAALAANGVGRGDRVGILINNRLEWLETVFGVTALGAVAVPFSTWSKPAELEFLLTDSQVRTLVTMASFGG